MYKKNFIKNLQNDIYCRIQSSKTHGVGVFAIRDIPKGVNPFKTTYGKCSSYKPITIDQKELKNVSKTIINMLDDFIGIDEDNKYRVPIKGLNSLDISFYMNHRENNNVDIIEDKKCDFTIFITNKVIKKGNELFINYNKFN